jgi:hypothetical protein
MHNNEEDYEINDILINDLAEHIKNGNEITDHYLYDPQSDLFEYEEKISVDTRKIGVDIIQKISNNSGK